MDGSKIYMDRNQPTRVEGIHPRQVTNCGGHATKDQLRLFTAQMLLAQDPQAVMLNTDVCMLKTRRTRS